MEEQDVPQSNGQTVVTPEATTIAPDDVNIAVVAEETSNPGCTCGRPGGSCLCGAEDAASPNDSALPSYVYAIGRVEPRFASLAAEKELAQAAGRGETSGLTDRQVLHDVLTQRENRYLARQLCYVLTVGGLETYILQPRDPADFELLIEAVRADPSPSDIDVVVGVRGPIAPPDMCGGLLVPVVFFDQLYSFDRDSLIKSVPRPEGVTAKQFEPTANEVFDRVIQVADNAGAMDEHRALNYLAVRYPAIYANAVEQHAEDFAMTGVDVLPSSLSGVRRIVEIILSYTNRNTDFTQKFFVRVDVTEEFPFLVTKLGPYYDH
jgi:PatG C-terminal